LAASPLQLAVAPSTSAGTDIVHALRSAATGLAQLQPREAAINLGLTAIIALAAVGLVRALDWLLRRGVERLAARGLVAGNEIKRGPKVAAMSRGLIKVAVVLAAAVLVLQVWGLAPLDWLSGRTGAALARVVVLVVVGVGALELSGRMIAGFFLGLQHRTNDPRRAAQFHTLAPIVKGLANGLLVLFVGLTVLSEVGVKIGPLLAGAGVVGVALGFGAQTLVKDFLTGLFLILEDIVSVGDNVRIGAVGGRVESMTLRTIRLRDFDGTLHVFPYSEAQVIHNQTKSFSYAVFAPQVSYLADIEQAEAIMREVGGQMQSAEPFSAMVLEPLEIVGVDQFTDVGVVLKARFKTRPGDQWRVGREFQRRLKLAFDGHGIEIGYPNVQADRAALAERESEKRANDQSRETVQ
jgi:small-conductance mechanosensitive channel